MKHFTTIEQSKKLLELGLSPETSDMNIPFYKDNNSYVEGIPATRPYDEVFKELSSILGKEESNKRLFPCWSLGALLDVMPHCITGWDGIEYTRITIGNVLEYSNRESGYTQSIISIPSNNLLSPAYNMVVWLLENGYIKK